MKKYVILDLDNCISDDAHRIPLIKWDEEDPTARYDAYHAACVSDNFVNQHLIPSGDVSAKIIIITSRPVKYREDTIAWLNQHDISNHLLIMRNSNDHRSSLLLKEEAVRWLSNLYGILSSEIISAVDDREDIVEMYQSHGIISYCVKAHNLPYAPKEDDGWNSSDLFFSDTPSTSDILEQAAKTFAERNKQYGDSYKVFGKAAQHMFPNGLQINTEEEWNRLGVFSMCLSKMTRYAAAMQSGGHQDSAHDLCVYAAMLEELTK